MKAKNALAALVFFILLFSTVAARGGGGCFLPETLIKTVSGEKPISEITIGETVLSIEDGNAIMAKVVAVYEVEASEYFEIRTANTEAKATGEQLIAISDGIFKEAKNLQAGENVLVFSGGAAREEKIVSVKRIEKEVKAFNLLTNKKNNYIANGIVAHNKGSFLPETSVLMASGEQKQITEIKVGDIVRAFDYDGNIVDAKVKEIYSITDNYYFVVRAGDFEAKVTAEHPFYIGNGKFKTAKKLLVGDEILVFDGNRLRKQEVTLKELVLEEITAYNLRTDWPDTFFANWIAVHNKGGGGGGGGGGGSSCTPTATNDCGIGFMSFIFGLFSFFIIGGFLSVRKGGKFSGKKIAATFLAFLIVYVALSLVKLQVLLFVFFFFSIFGISIIGSKFAGKYSDENLDYCYPAAQVEKKAVKTSKLVDYLAGIDKTWNPETLKQIARSTFLKLQECWQAREYSPMQSLLMPDLYAQHLGQIESLKRNHEIDKMDNIEIKKLEIVNVRHSAKREQQEFTVLFEASMKDYYVDDTTGAFLRGDSEPATFQEFWVFQRQGNNWLLREIDQSRESDALREENFAEELTQEQLKNIYGATLAVKAPEEKANWLSGAISEKSGKVQRLLNFLSSTDKTWDEDYLKETSRKIFVSVFGAMEKQDISTAAPLMMQEAIEKYSKIIEAMKKENRSVEYRNICVRKIDIVLVQNYNDNNKDEFTTRISAHAQRIEKKNGKTANADEYVSPFEEYWTFQKQKGKWTLKETALPAMARAFIQAENIDEESSKEQLQWYYSKDRAL